mgnify:FL=1
MTRLLTIAAAITLLTAAQSFACNPKQDPNCDNLQDDAVIELTSADEDPHAGLPLPLDVIEAEEDDAEIACNPKVDPGCNNCQPDIDIEWAGTIIGNGLLIDVVSRTA